LSRPAAACVDVGSFFSTCESFYLQGIRPASTTAPFDVTDWIVLSPVK
jgi:hypothetical protein